MTTLEEDYLLKRLKEEKVEVAEAFIAELKTNFHFRSHIFNVIEEKNIQSGNKFYLMESSDRKLDSVLAFNDEIQFLVTNFILQVEVATEK